MAERRPVEDEAMLYVLGRLGRAERRKFQARLKESSELRALVRDLETGTVALAMAMPQCQAPPQAWENVKDAVARKAKARAFFVTWIRSGWAAAACVLMGWLIYALWINRSPQVSEAILSPEIVEREPDVGVVANPDGLRALRQPHSETNVVPSKATTLARIGEVATLRRQLRDLEEQLAHMSQVMTQQQTFPSEPGQLEFFQLMPAGSDGAAGRVPKPPSPELQRALLIGMARELGWLRPSGTASSAAPPSPKPEKETKPETQPPTAAPTPAPVAAADLGVNFVDLPAEDGSQPSTTAAIGAEEAKKLKSILAEPTTSSPETGTTDSPESAIPVLRSPTNLILAIDSSVFPYPGTNTVTVWTGPQINATSSSEAPGAALIPRGSFTLRNSPTVLTIPWANVSGTFTPIVFTVGGSSNGYPGGPGVVSFAPAH